MGNIAIITARGGSKRIPKKNIKEFLGKPIIAYSIEAALQSGIFEEVMVSTDSEEIAEIAKKYGASVPFLRSEKTSDDHATTADVISEVIEKYEEEGKHYDAFCCIYPTAPFVTAERLREACEKLSGASIAPRSAEQQEHEDAKAIGDSAEQMLPNAVVTVVSFSFPPQRAFIQSNGMLAYKWPEFRSARSQDLEPFYHDAGQFYFVRTKAFLEEKTVVPTNTAPLVLPETEVQDIDNESDWDIAEIKYRKIHSL